MMNRILKRPMFRMGGRSDDGIMSVRPGYALGDRVKNFFKLDPAKGNLQSRGIGFLKKAYNLFPEEGLLSKGARQFPAAAAATKTTGLMTAPFVLPAAIAASNYPVYPKGHPKEGEFMPREEAVEVLKEAGQIGTAADEAGEAAMFDLETGEYPNKKYATKLDYESPEVLEISRELNLLPKDEDIPDPDKSPPKLGKDDISSDEDTMESYLKMFKEAAGDSPEDVSRERFLELAKFGANLLAQPGGDLVGAVGKAAAPAIEGLSRSAAARKQSNKEFKLAALKLAIDKMDNPTADKIKTLARLSGLDEKEIARSMIQDPTSDTTKESIITTNQAAMSEEIGNGPALKAARTMAEAGLNFGLFSLLPVDKKGNVKEDTADGFYYDDKGNLFQIEKGVSSQIKLSE